MSTKRTIMLVDDEEGPRTSLWMIFKDEYNILQAESGELAVELAKKNKVDIAVLDIRMQGMSGTECLEKLKQIDHHMEVIMLTGYETSDTIKEALRSGACDYLNKPFNVSVVRGAIAKAAQRRSISEDILSSQTKLEQLKVEISNQQTQLTSLSNQIAIYASVLHDIANPLTAIAGGVEMVLHDLSVARFLTGEDLDRLKHKISSVTLNASNCIDICRRYLTYLRHQAGEADYVQLSRVFDDLNMLLKYSPNLDGHKLVIHPTPADLVIHVNGLDLLQILVNLVNNALQATADVHEVHVKASPLDGPLNLDTMKDGPQDRIVNREVFTNAPKLVAITVHDTGPGIPPDVVPRLFTPFYSTKPITKGSGLGLSITQKLSGNGHGLVHLHTVPGHGTTFTIYFPSSSASS